MDKATSLHIPSVPHFYRLFDGLSIFCGFVEIKYIKHIFDRLTVRLNIGQVSAAVEPFFTSNQTANINPDKENG